MNKVILVGRLSQDPEVRYTKTEKAVASFSLAVDDGWGDNKKTYFVPIVAWDKLAEICGNNLSKGQRALIDGKLQIRSYEDKDGQKRRVTEVIAQNIEFLEKKRDKEIVIPGQESPMDAFGKANDQEISF